MSSGFEGAGWLWRFMDREDGPGMWHHTDNAEHAELLGRRLSVEVRELAFADDVRQLAEQRAALLEALDGIDELFQTWQCGFASGIRPDDNEPEEQALWDAITEKRAAIANATQQSNATGGEG